MAARQQPAWTAPTGTFKTGLTVANGLTNRKDEFIPTNGKHVSWYICGPTVYDSSHLGHARTYLSFDIIRRIMEDYFGYDVEVCMNITDIDDKIIIGARKNYLFKEYVQKVTSKAKLEDDDRETIKEALSEFIKGLEQKSAKIESDVNTGKRSAKDATPELNLVREKLAAANAAQERAIAELSTLETGESVRELLMGIKDALSGYLDVRQSASLSHEVLNRITKEHSALYEAEYFADMRALGIKNPDALTRVTEYVPEVIEMCERIIANGFAYESNGSVYFNVEAFDSSESHHYAKLVPHAYGNQDLVDEGEGGLSLGGERRSPNDFALWKKSKVGEPAWESPWGLGRPGWHIECSAMAGNILGQTLDIHAGGVDLKFPHHDNELAQSEAYFNNAQWVNYFLHTGHLHIDGLKMSKSLKNFITIREMLAKHPARHVRWLFLLQSWDNSMNYQRVDTMREVIAKEKYFKEFFLRVEHVLGERTMLAGAANEHWNAKDKELSAAIATAQRGVHIALSDNFDTARAMQCLSDLVTHANTYMEKNSEKKAFLLKKAATFVTRILRVFGVITGAQEFGFDSESASVSAATTSEGLSARDIARPYVTALVDFRKRVRQLAKEAGNASGALLQATDALRDDVMPKLDVKIADDSEFGFVFQDRAELEKERAERLAAEDAVRRTKLQNQLNRLEKEVQKFKSAAVPPADLIHQQFLVKLNSPDEELPEHNEKGDKISKSAKKDIKKVWNKQETAHKAYLDQLAANPNFLSQLESDVAALKAQLGL